MQLKSLFAITASAALAAGASLKQVTNFGENPSSIQMYIYVPDKVATKPAVIVAVSKSGRLVGLLRTKTSLSYILVVDQPPSGTLEPNSLRTLIPMGSFSSTPEQHI